MWCGVLLLVASSGLLNVVRSEINLDGVSGREAEVLKELDANVQNLRSHSENLQGLVNFYSSSFKELAKQTQAAQLFVEERIRSDGNSGVKQARSYNHGTDAYMESTHIGKGACAMHDHYNSNDILGLGEANLVINGVDFRTRHNDAHIRQPSTTDTSFNAFEKIKFPDVPPEVLNQPTIEAQITEMQQWLKAFKDQDYSVRDYRKYFRPIMCYFEGFWTLDKQLSEPFVARRHTLEAKTWDQLRQQIEYTSYTGGKNFKENFSFLPRKIISVNETTGVPTYAQWNYNILCHPYSGDIPTKYLRQQDDWSYMESYHKTHAKVNNTFSARYRISAHEKPRFVHYDIMDKIFAEIPGKDNVPPFLSEEPLGDTLYDVGKPGNVKLNTGYYHRMYKSGGDGMLKVNRGFSDEHLYFAETTQERIAPVEFRYCVSGRECYDRSTRFTYAIPFELVYLSPLLTWNPYNITVHWSAKTPKVGGRNGGLTQEKAFDGASYYMNYFITPVDLFLQNSNKTKFNDKYGATGVLDNNKQMQKVVASGTRIIYPNVPGVGTIRYRYPCFDLHVEGSAIWKELSAAKIRLTGAVEVTQKSNLFHIKMYPTNIGEHHDHEIYLTGDEYFDAVQGGNVSVATSVDNGHHHDLEITWSKDNERLETVMCDGVAGKCWDEHSTALIIEDKPF